jgi:hypothetical protein
MLDALGTFAAYVVAMGLVAAPLWWLAALWRRRRVAAATRAAADLDGRYEPAGSRRFSGGTIYGRRDGRDVVVVFFTGHSRKSADTTALATLKAPRSGRLSVRRKLFGGWDGADGLPPGGVATLERLASFRFARVEAWSNMLSVRVAGVLHDAARIVELATITAGLASELERASGRPGGPGSR